MLRFALSLVAAVLTLFQAVGLSQAATVNLTFDNVVGAPSSVIVNTDSSVYLNENGSGVNAVPVSGPGQSTLGNGSWQAAGVGSYNHLTVYALNTGSGGINEGAFTGYAPGGATIRVRDIESFSFDTLQPAGTSLADWNVTIYTLPDSVNDDAWYGRRMIFEPAYAYNFSGPKDTWNTWSSGPGTNQLAMIDTPPTGGGGEAATDAGSGGPTLLDVTGNTIMWDPSSEGGLWPSSGETKGTLGTVNDATIDYRDEVVWLIRVNIGSPNNHPMLVDNFNFSLKSSFDAGFDTDLVGGQTVIIDFEDPNFVEILPAIPEPSSLILLGLGGIFLQAVRRRRCAS